MTAIGALIGLSLSILLIIRKLSPTYSLIIGAIVGGLLGGLSLNETVTVMTEGVKEVTPAVLRILTAGVLSGILIQTGATTVISNAIINKMGEKRVFMALALATMLLCTVGVFIDVAGGKRWPGGSFDRQASKPVSICVTYSYDRGR